MHKIAIKHKKHKNLTPPPAHRTQARAPTLAQSQRDTPQQQLDINSNKEPHQRQPAAGRRLGTAAPRGLPRV